MSCLWASLRFVYCSANHTSMLRSGRFKNKTRKSSAKETSRRNLAGRRQKQMNERAESSAQVFFFGVGELVIYFFFCYAVSAGKILDLLTDVLVCLSARTTRWTRARSRQPGRIRPSLTSFHICATREITKCLYNYTKDRSNK